MVSDAVIKTKKKAPPGLGDLIGLYELSNQAEGKSPKTTSWYTEMLQAYSTYLSVNHHTCDLAAFEIDAVRSYILYLKKKPKFQGHVCSSSQSTLLSPRTVQGHVRALKAFSSWLYIEGYTIENRLQNLKLPKAPSTIIEPLTPGEIEKIIASIDKKSSSGARNHTLFITLLDTGLRASEAAGITLSNLNLADGFVKVMGKGAKERIVPIGKHVRMVLFSYIDKVRPKPTDPDCNNLFLSSTGKPITVNTVKLMFSRLAQASGVKRLHAHLCRHTFATNYLLNGGDIFSLKEILGHGTFEMVNHYLHFTSSQITSQHHKYSPMDKLQSELAVGAIEIGS
jgi:site-specific recombinase XerD